MSDGRSGPASPVAILRRRAADLLPGGRERRLQVVAHATAWQQANEVARAGAGPLWVVLGDSTAQAIGATAHDRGYVGQLLAVLPEGAGVAWRVVNLSRSGARVADVLAEQVPALAQVAGEVGLVTCAVGANDLLPGRGRGLEVQVVALLDALPAGAVVATLPQGIRQARAEALNELIRAEAPRRGLRVADVWARSGPPWRDSFSSDHFHPNDTGYRRWAEAFAVGLGLDPAIVGGRGGHL